MASRSSRSSSRRPLTVKPVEFPTTPTRTPFTSISLELDRDNSRRLTVMLDGAPSSFIDLDDPSNVVFEYMEIFLTVIAQLDAGPLTVTHLGSAGSTMARAIESVRPNSRQIGVDIDQQLLDFAREWFDLPKSPRLRLRSGDARAQLELINDASQDVIIRDVFANGAVPEHLTTLEFTELVLRKLKPGGLYLLNCADKPPLKIARAEVATLFAAAQQSGPEDQEVTRQASVFLISEPGILKGRRFGNVVLGLVNSVKDNEPAVALNESDPMLARALRSLAVPAHILTDTEAKSFSGTAAVLRDRTTPDSKNNASGAIEASTASSPEVSTNDRAVRFS